MRSSVIVCDARNVSVQRLSALYVKHGEFNILVLLHAVMTEWTSLERSYTPSRITIKQSRSL